MDCKDQIFTLLRRFSDENVYQNRENVHQNCSRANKSEERLSENRFSMDFWMRESVKSMKMLL